MTNQKEATEDQREYAREILKAYAQIRWASPRSHVRQLGAGIGRVRSGSESRSSIPDPPPSARELIEMFPRSSDCNCPLCEGHGVLYGEIRCKQHGFLWRPERCPGCTITLRCENSEHKRRSGTIILCRGNGLRPLRVGLEEGW
jgi:hypothetical protein